MITSQFMCGVFLQVYRPSCISLQLSRQDYQSFTLCLSFIFTMTFFLFVTILYKSEKLRNKCCNSFLSVFTKIFHPVNAESYAFVLLYQSSHLLFSSSSVLLGQIEIQPMQFPLQKFLKNNQYHHSMPVCICPFERKKSPKMSSFPFLNITGIG